MKKMVRTGKKTLALFLTVVMLMTAWVFVAPEKAEAVTSTNYPVKFYANVSDEANGCNNYVTITYITNNGKGSTTSTQYSLDSLLNNGTGNGKTQTINVPGYPTKFSFSISRSGSSPNVINVRLYRVDIGNLHVVDDGYEINTTAWWGGRSWEWTPSNCKTSNWTAPKASSVVFDQAPSNVTLNKTGNTTTAFRTHVNDQYGVRIASAASTYSKSATLSSNRSYTTGYSNSWGNTTDTYDPNTITMTQSARILNNYDDNTITANVSYTFNGATVSASKQFTVTDPNYIFYLNPNGGEIYHNNQWYSSQQQYTKRYGNTLTSAQLPSSGRKTGYEFIGMYSGSAKADNYSFTKPVAGSTSGYTGQLTTSTQYTADTTWYAAWWAKNITAKFVNNDGTAVGTVTGKYDKTIEDVASAAVDALGIPTYHKKPGESGTYDYVFSGWRVLSAKDINGNDYYPDELSTDKAVLKGDTVFEAVYTPVQNSYTVNFYDFNGNKIAENSKDDYIYGDPITQPAPLSNYEDNTFTYKFKGWTSVDKDAEKKGFIVDENGLTDDGIYVPVTNISKVRNNAYYVPVFEKKYIDYTVTFNYNDGETKTATVHYGETVELPEVLASYFKDGRQYTFLNTWTKNLNGNKVTGVTLTSPFEVKESAVYTAEYENAAAVYNIAVHNYDGAEIGTYPVDHGTAFGLDHGPQIDIIEGKITKAYDDDAAHYDYTGEWQTADGVNVGTLAELKPTNNMDIYPVYEKTARHTVNFYNGEELVSSVKVTENGLISLHEATTKAGDKYAEEYTFKCWADENGTVYDESNNMMPNHDLDLYAQYDCTPINYTVKFVRDDGSVISEKTDYHYGDKIAVPTEEEREKAQDNTYTYTFRDYDKNIAEVCDGDATYTAYYKRTYRYYKVTWLNEDGTVLKTENYIYNERINPPAATPSPVITEPSDENHEIAFDAWHYCDASGKPTDKIYARGDRLDGELTFMAGYVETAKLVKATFLDADGEVYFETEVPFGTLLSDVAYPIPQRASTDEYHFNFVCWMDGPNDTDSTYRIADDTTFAARFSYDKHDYATAIDVEKVPTFFEDGAAVYACSCGMTENRGIAPLADTVAPTSRLYIKNTYWNSGDVIELGDGIPAAANNQLIINTDDKAYTDASKTPADEMFNAANRGSGIAAIEYAVVGQNEEPTTWETKFSFDELKTELYTQAWIEAGGSKETFGGNDSNVNQTIYAQKLQEADAYLASFETNASGTLGDIARYTSTGNDLVDGDRFVVYVKVTDRKGNVTTMHSPLMKYDTTPAEVNLIGEYHYGSKYCEEVTVEVKFQNTNGMVTLNGKAVALDENKQFTVNAKGIYQVVATDAAGNLTTVNFEIVGEHSWKAYNIEPTCTVDGEQYERCTLCGAETEHIKVEALDHDTKGTDVYTAPTCTERGFTTYTCNNCGEKSIVVDETENGNPIGHDYKATETLTATCVKEGYEIKTCANCGDVISEILPIDANAHSYYRPDITKPTCDKDGVGVRICKYCGHEDIIDKNTEGYEYLGERPAHEFEAIVGLEPSCEQAGTKKFVCANCGEVQKDEEGNEVTEEISALGHDFKYVETVEPTETEQGYTLYKCSRCGVEDKRDYTTKLEQFTVSYEVDGKTETIAKTQGEALTSADLPTPTKEADETYKYTFDKWVYADGTDVKLPLTVESDVSIKAEFSKRYINYTFTFMKEVEKADGTTELVQVQKIGYLHNGDEVKLPAGPTKASDAMYDYNCEDWYVKDLYDATYTTYTVNASDVTFVAHFTATRREYKVTFATNVDNILDTVTVKAGETAVYTGNIPTKASDKNYHYQFSGNWSKDVTNVQCDMFVTAIFTPVKHNFTANIIHEADCTTAQIVEYICDCGYSYTQSSGSPAGHDWLTPVEENGQMIQHCSKCDATREDPTTYTVEFYNDDGTTLVKRIGFLKYGEDITDRIPTPTKASTDSEEFVFAGWDSEVQTTVTGNAKYIATYTSKPLSYVVIYAVNSDNVLQTTKDVPGGTLLSEVPYTGETPTKANDATNHYIFTGWSMDQTTKVTKDLYILAQFDKQAHTYKDEPINATCTTGSGVKHTCTVCGFSYVEETGPAKGHQWVLIDSKVPTFDEPGYDEYECVVCHEHKITDYEQKQFINIIITVYDHDNNPVEGAKVSLYDEIGLVASGSTNNNGVVILQVPEAKEYTIVISVDNGETSSGKITVDENGKITGGEVPHIDASKCECPCHNNGFWGAIFRFFHKIIKIITGEFKCCSNPDARYYN